MLATQSIQSSHETADAERASARAEVADYEAQLAGIKAEAARVKVDAARVTLETERQAKLAEVNARLAERVPLRRRRPRPFGPLLATRSTPRSAMSPAAPVSWPRVVAPAPTWSTEWSAR
jgi:phosphoenolpyruvate carboxylase